jgi:cytoskeletal protein CcmA (bactofilin family)
MPVVYSRVRGASLQGREAIVIGRNRKENAPEAIETTIGPTANFIGDLRSDGGVRIQGMLEGLLETAGNLVVEEKAQIIADVSAYNVSVAGVVRGDIVANRVEVLSTGRVWGDVSVNSLLLDEGGFIQGRVNMQGDGLEPPQAISQTMEVNPDEQREQLPEEDDGGQRPSCTELAS